MGFSESIACCYDQWMPARQTDRYRDLMLRVLFARHYCLQTLVHQFGLRSPSNWRSKRLDQVPLIALELL
ncbi:hypothetical protein EGJ64_26295 [Pseudomonas aeruginosa]|nr:hypothetical protein EGJ64_26295 [Pseudomonas aeruginosa]RRW86723.1 hypothetical protein EGJ69_25330 [Pseudomonas aeruginosa]RRX17621.1 hypothetical protein EGJ84_24280 [Pseudomonas aeruginosa]RRX35257.1 hypothetical protein EGJ75_24970 [Pseudomonas aeruginosa]RRY53444.1 hypothetical protein EGJ92_18545 [Pseudomonas aeruginosa]